MRKIGYFLVSCIPILIAFALQTAGMAVLMAKDAIEGKVVPELLQDKSYVSELSMKTTIIYLIIGAIVFGLWYIFGTKRTRYEKASRIVSAPNIFAIIFLAIGCQAVISAVLEWIQLAFPGSLDAYQELLETAGIGQMNTLSLVTTVILAPIVEEFMFRGISIHFLRYGGMNFWVANLLQAALFGAYHMNIVQGVYAFILGFVLGYIYYKYGSIIMCMLLHLCINLTGTLLGTYGAALNEGLTTIYIMMGVGVICVILGLVFVIKNTEKLETRAFYYD